MLPRNGSVSNMTLVPSKYDLCQFFIRKPDSPPSYAEGLKETIDMGVGNFLQSGYIQQMNFPS